jgi:hypothetical protein
MQPLSSFTFADPKVMQDPYPYYERLRAEDPVHFDEGVRTWLITRHDDILAVARNTEVYSDEMRVSKSIRSPFQAEVDEHMQREGFQVLDPADSFKLDGDPNRGEVLLAGLHIGAATEHTEAAWWIPTMHMPTPTASNFEEIHQGRVRCRTATQRLRES